MDVINIKRLTTTQEAELLDHEFAEQYPWYKQGDYFRKCLEENYAGSRITLMAFYDEVLAGCCHLLYSSYYPYFRDNKIPEINDLNVFPKYRRMKIASRLFDELETIVSNTSKYIGVGVGLYKDYGNAQRMYTSRGYVMDGKGMTYKNVQVEPGKPVMVDDDLIIYLIKELKDNV
jgi:GNAT superfamily N-acetyltransferase